MKNILLSVKSITKKDLLVYVILVLIFLYYLIGIFPITRFETDSMNIANACEEMIQSGKFEENVLGHSYDMQTGTYFLIVAVAKTTGLDAFMSYSILTIIFAIVYWVFLFLLLRKITKANHILIIIVLFLFQEIFVLSYYANSAVIASAFWIISFYILWAKNDNVSFIISAILLSFAMWFRVDVAFAFPSVLLLFYMKNNKVATSLIKSFILAIVVVLTNLFLMYLMNANIAGIFQYTETHGELFSTEHNIGLLDLHVIKAHAAYFSVLLIFLIFISIVFLFIKKNFMPILLLISGVVFYYLLGINNTIAPKHLSYFTLFWSVIIIWGLNYYNDFKPIVRNTLSSIAIFLFIIQYIIGVRFDITTIPYQFEKNATLNPEPTILTLGSINLNKLSIQRVDFVIGTGTKISTADEISASSGLLFSPMMWYKQKKGLNKSFGKLSEIINHSASDTLLLNVTEGSSEFVINNLLTNGFIWKEKQIDFSSDVQLFTFIKPDAPLIKITRYYVNKNNFQDLLINFNNENFFDEYFVFLWDWKNYYTEKLELPYIENTTYHIHKIK